MPIRLLRFIDRLVIGTIVFLLSPITLVSRRNIRKESIAKPKKILVIRLWALGSSLLTFPMVVRLRKEYGPDVTYHLLATPRNSAVFRNQGYFSRTFNLFRLGDLWELFLSFRSYDIVIDTEEYFRISSLCALWLGKISCGYGNIPARARAYVFPVRYEERVQNLLNCLSLLGPLGISFDAPDKMEPLKYSEEDRDKADAFLVPYAQDMFKIALHSGGAETAPERFWSAKNWVELCERLVAEYGSNVRIFLTGTEFERAQVEKIFAAVSPEASERMVNVCGAFGIFPFARFLERMDVVVSNDTGPMHLAAAMGTPTIGLFGPDIPEAFGPYPPDRNVALYHGEGKNYLRVHLGEYETPPPGLVDLIGVGEVMEAVSKFL